jgi:ribose-phosphate pyrophosphokinase
VGNGIGPVLEARDVMRVLQNDPRAPNDLRQKALRLAGRLIECDPDVRGGDGYAIARDILDSGRALARMRPSSPRRAQGVRPQQPQPGRAALRDLRTRRGVVAGIDNQQIARIARLAGAPKVQGAGVDLLCKLGDTVAPGQPCTACMPASRPTWSLPARPASGQRLPHGQRRRGAPRVCGVLSMAAPDAPAWPACCTLTTNAPPPQRLAAACGLPALEIARHRFPDGELKLHLPVDAAGQLPARAVLLRSLHQPNEKLIELLLAARSRAHLGVRHLTLVAPYLAYMRQDIAFHPGEAVSQRIVGPFLASLFDAVVTVDPHLHRVATLHEAVPAARTVVLSGAPLLADWIVQQRPGALLVGPDGESAQWVAQAAARHGLEHAVCTKERHGDRSVTIHLPPVAVQGRAVVLLDDMASTGHTLAQAARLLLQDGAASVDVAVTHALIDAEALAALHAAGVGEFWSTDCVAHPTNAVAMAVELARGVGQLWGFGADIPG